jgi:hypothetical protein
MSWFGRNKRATDLQELWDAIRTLTRTLESKDLDWADMRARCRRLLDRTEKAASRVQSDEPVTTAPDGEENGVQISLGSHPGRLTDRQKQIQQQILRRRGGVP